MNKVILIFTLLVILAQPVMGAEITPPEVPAVGERYMPTDTESFSEGLWYVIRAGIVSISPSISEASGICLSLIAIILFISILHNFSNQTQKPVLIAGAVGIGLILLESSNSMIQLSMSTVSELSNYGKLLLPILTTALAAQGGTSSSTALYAGTTLFCTLLSTLISRLLVPLVYIYLCLAVAEAAIGEDVIKSIKNFIKWLITWSMKTVLYVFSGYLGITKIISGSVDAAALRATKLTISGVVPVVGKIISDASETILVSAGIVKNSVGVYGLLAILSVLIGPFLKIGVQYLLIKLTSSICSVFGIKQASSVIADFSNAMAMTLGMLGIIGLMLMISTVCFMKGVS